jgi:hypothetical protein
MPLSRRGFLKGLVGTAAGILVAPEILAEPERRVWALDGSMVRPYELRTPPIPDWISKLEPHDTPLLDHIWVSDKNYYQRFEWSWGNRHWESITPQHILIGDEIMQIAGPMQRDPESAHLMIPVYRGRLNQYPKEVSG